MAIRKINTATLFHHMSRPSNFIAIPSFLIKNNSSIPASQHKNLNALRDIFERYGVPTSKFPNFLRKNEFLLNSSPSDIEKSCKILLSFTPSKEFLVSTITGCPRLLQLEFLEKWQPCISQLGIYNMTSMAVSSVLEIGRKFEVSPDDVLRCVECLKDLGFSESTITRVLEAVPMVIISTQDKIRSKVDFLMIIGLQRTEIDRVCSLFPKILEIGVENRLKPLFDEFRDLGFHLNDIRREILRDPTILGLENGEISVCVEMLRSLKCRAAIKDEIFRGGQLQAGFKAKLRIDCLRKHGLIYRDAFTVLWKEPRVILYELEDSEQKIEFLVHKMKFDVQCLVEVPEYLGVNFDKQIVPRFNVIEYLRSVRGLGDEVGLRNLVKMSRLRFYNMYVKPYPECEKMYGRFAGNGGVVGRIQYPVGMWKLFKPQRYPETSDDVRNIKAYVESLP